MYYIFGLIIIIFFHIIYDAKYYIYIYIYIYLFVMWYEITLTIRIIQLNYFYFYFFLYDTTTKKMFHTVVLLHGLVDFHV